MKKLPRIVVISNKAENLEIGALLTEPPFLVAKTWCVEPTDIERLNELNEQIASGGLVAVRVRGFSIYLLAGGCLTGGCDDADAIPLLNEMAEVIRAEELIPRATRWKDYALDKEKVVAERKALKEERKEVERQRRYDALERKLFGR